MHVYILQFLLIYNITFTNFAFFSFPEFQQSAFCAVSELQHLPQTSSVSARPHIHLKQLHFHPPPLEAMWARSCAETPLEKLRVGPDNIYRLLIYETEAFSLFCLSYFLPSLMTGSRFFQSRWAVVMSTTVVSERDTQCALEIHASKCKCLLSISSYD